MKSFQDSHIDISNMTVVKSVAIIGAGPAGAIAVDALAQEQAFDIIRIFERREKAGGCWSVFYRLRKSVSDQTQDRRPQRSCPTAP